MAVFYPGLTLLCLLFYILLKTIVTFTICESKCICYAIYHKITFYFTPAYRYCFYYYIHLSYVLITLLITLLGSVSDLLDFQRFSDFENAWYSSIPLRSTNQTLEIQGFFHFLSGYNRLPFGYTCYYESACSSFLYFSSSELRS